MLFPLVIGIVIYLLTRPEHTLLSFLIPHGYVKLPDWVTFNLPDGLWLFTLLNGYCIVWGKQNYKPNMIWIVGTALLAAGTEVLQKFHIVGGTFDLLDISFYFIAFLATTILYFTNHLNPIKN